MLPLATAAVVLVAAVKEVLQTVTVTPTATCFKTVAMTSHQHVQQHKVISKPSDLLNFIQVYHFP